METCPHCGATLPASSPDCCQPARTHPLSRAAQEVVAWVKTLASAAVYATLIITFLFQIARVEGTSMAPTLQD